MTHATSAITMIAAPTLIVHGREDQVIPLQNAHDLLQAIPDAQLHVFGRCGHWTQLEHADAFNELVTRFLRDVDVNAHLT
jgi:pimeloyl-ACP methyl ester carboxylesterase